MTELPSQHLPDVASGPTGSEQLPTTARLAGAVERMKVIDKWGRVIKPVAGAVGAGSFGRLLRGEQLGHAAHPMLTDLPIGFWTSAVTLDLCRGRAARSDVTALLGLGILSALPTALTGMAEWDTTSTPESRVGIVHAWSNSVGLVCFTAAWRAHRRSTRGRAVLWELAGTTAATVGGLLGGHLATVRKVGSRDSAYLADGVGPVLSRP